MNDDWHDAMSKMNEKLNKACAVYPRKLWFERLLIQKKKYRLAAKIAMKRQSWRGILRICIHVSYIMADCSPQSRERQGTFPAAAWEADARWCCMEYIWEFFL